MATINKSATYEFGDFRVETASFRLLQAGRPVDLEPKALELLIFFLESGNQMLGKTEILNAVWGDAFVTENALSREIALLRKALRDDSKQPKYIETVQGRGYRFVAPIKELPATQKPSASPPSPVAVQPELAAKRRRWSTGKSVIVAAATLMFLAGLGLVLWLQSTTSVRRKSQVTFSSGLDFYPTFSPDGNSLAYCSDASGKFEIYVRQLASGGTEVAITSDGAQNVEPAWSPDGRWLAYHSKIKGGIWLVSALGGQPRRLTEFGARPAWSPDGLQIVFQSADAGAYAAMEVGAPPDSTIWTVAVADGTLHQITHPQAPLWPVGPSAPQWSPDGKRIIFSNADGIWRVDPSSGAASSVLASGFAYDAIFAPNGRTIFFSSADNEGPSIWMISINPKTGAAVGPRRKLHNLGAAVAHNLAVSPDGRHLMFSGITTFDNLYSVTLDASGRAAGSPTALTHDTRLRKALPAISPDGRTVAFDVLEPSSPFQIWTVGSDGRNAQKVSSNGGIFPSWLPTGDLTWVANALDAKGPMPSNNSLEILARDHTSGAIHKIGWGPNKMGFARLSPDGKRIAYQTTDGGVINVWTVRVSDGTKTDHRGKAFGRMALLVS